MLQTRRCTAAAAAWNLKQPTHLLMGLPRRRGRTLLSFHCEYYKIASVLRERNPAFPHKDVCVFVFLFFKCRKKTHRASSVMRFNRWDNEPSGGGVCSLAERTELGWVTCTPEFLLVDSVVFISWCHNGVWLQSFISRTILLGCFYCENTPVWWSAHPFRTVQQLEALMNTDGSLSVW